MNENMLIKTEPVFTIFHPKKNKTIKVGISQYLEGDMMTVKEKYRDWIKVGEKFQEPIVIDKPAPVEPAPEPVVEATPPTEPEPEPAKAVEAPLTPESLDYDISGKSIAAVKTMAMSGEYNLVQLLQSEIKGKNRKTLIKWLKSEID